MMAASMSRRVCIIDVPGLTRELLPNLPAGSSAGKWLGGRRIAELTPSWPAVTCTVQATLTTGKSPSEHGIICNGIVPLRHTNDRAYIDESSFANYRRDVSFWEQSNQLLDVPRFWEGGDGVKTWGKTALLFFQQSMPGFAGVPRPAADVVLTPKPEHGADGSLKSLCWSKPPELVGRLFSELGPFPLMNYWGPFAGIASSRWIGAAAARVWREQQPGLQWVYLPHLDYDLQRFGPQSAQAAKAVSELAPVLDELVDEIHNSGGAVVLLSEYAMQPVSRGIRLNAHLREAGLLQTRLMPEGHLIDYGQSRAFAVVDHQIAHIYVRDSADCEAVGKLLSSLGADVLDPRPIEHPRAGDLQVQSLADAWFDYRWWTDPAAAPTFATTVDIHRKPGYDPLELFMDMATRTIRQDEGLIRGSHGRVAAGKDGGGALLACDQVDLAAVVDATEVAGLIGRIAQS